MTDPLAKIGLTGSILTAFAAFCCVLPMVLMLLGLGGAWLAAFATIAAAGFYLGGVSLVLLVAAWVVALRRGSRRQTIAMLSVGSALIAASLLVVLSEAAINDYIISLM